MYKSASTTEFCSKRLYLTTTSNTHAIRVRTPSQEETTDSSALCSLNINRQSIYWGERPLGYSVKHGANEALALLKKSCKEVLPASFVKRLENVIFCSSHAGLDTPLFPCPMKEQEAVAAVRGLEGAAAAVIADMRFDERKRDISVDVSKIALFLMSAYVTTIDGLGKGDPRVRERIPDTDLYEAQSVLYRRLAANLYETKIPGEYYHIHGSLEASKTLQMLGLESHRPDLQTYRECLSTIGEAVRQFDTTELEKMNKRVGQAGAPALKCEVFLETPHGKALAELAPYTIRQLESNTKPVSFSKLSHKAAPSQILSGIYVLELCRVLAGPVIGRSLAAHGASVLKVTCKDLPDVPFFQLDVNIGKHTTSLDLRNEGDRNTFEDLLWEADVIVDGYRPGALNRLGYGTKAIQAWAERRDKGYVYVAEDCFGGTGLETQNKADWASRPGWQQIADCVTGVAWEQGRFMGLEEPVVPPFPMSDYGTGALGCVAAMTGLYKRATEGGSWICRTSLCQNNLFLLSLGLYPKQVQDELRNIHDETFFALRHNDSVDEVSKAALNSMRRLHEDLFNEDMLQSSFSEVFQGIVTWPKEALEVEGLRVGHVRSSRPNGNDAPTWAGWEKEQPMLEDD